MKGNNDTVLLDKQQQSIYKNKNIEIFNDSDDSDDFQEGDDDKDNNNDRLNIIDNKDVFVNNIDYIKPIHGATATSHSINTKAIPIKVFTVDF